MLTFFLSFSHLRDSSLDWAAGRYEEQLLAEHVK